MTETQKTLAALLAENPDNTSGVITPEISRNTIVSTFNRYGGIRVTTNAVSTSLAVQNTWYQIDKFDEDSPADGATPDHTNDHITIDATGTYEVRLNCSFSGSASDTYQVAVRINDGASQAGNVLRSRGLGVGGDVGACNAGDIVALTLGDTVEMWVRCTTDAGNNITVENANLYVRQLSGV